MIEIGLTERMNSFLREQISMEGATCRSSSTYAKTVITDLRNSCRLLQSSSALHARALRLKNNCRYSTSATGSVCLIRARRSDLAVAAEIRADRAPALST